MSAAESAASAAAPLTVMVLLRAKPGCAERVQEEIAAQLRAIRAEQAACVRIVGNRHETERDRFLIYEEWRSRAEFDAFYEGNEQLNAYLARMQELVAEGELTYWEAVA